ncbi:MAG: hypothetical protein ACKVW3_12600 [Phycisphaerales bacterium]
MFDQLMAQTPIIHAAATWFMVGLIWFVQVVHYPLMGAVPPHAFSAYATSHQRRTTWVVGPVMLIEVSSALLLVRAPQENFTGTMLPWIGLALLVLIWVSTFAVQVPLHARLASGFDRAVWSRLVATNWVRTIAWTVRGIIALLLLG